MQKAVFIDRDGVINSDEGLYYIHRVEDFKLNPQIVSNIQMLKNEGFMVIVITNQGGVARQKYTLDDVQKLHRHMLTLFQKQDVIIDEIYFCPHHSEIENCLCRKPKPILIQKAMARFGIDKSKSYLIGDNPRDVEAASNAGILGIKVDANSDIVEACRFIINDFNTRWKHCL